MNYKSLLFTALAGVMITSACVKNLESPSVTKVREAKAAEMEAAAALNKANAEATVTLANANAALTLAKAEVEKANAAKIAAETELVRINAELARVNVELAKVKVDEEKVKLEILKEQLEQEKIATEQAKAQAEYILKQYEQKMQELIDQMELEALNHQVEMQKALNDLEEALAEYNETERAIILDLYTQIAAGQGELLNANTQLLSLEAYAAQLEANLENPEEVYAELIKKYQGAIKRNEIALEYYRELEGMSSEELSTLSVALWYEYQRILNEANNLDAELRKANKNYWDANSEYNAVSPYNWNMRSAILNNLPYTSEINGEIVSNITEEVLFTPESGYDATLTPAKTNVEALTDHIEALGNKIDEKYIKDVSKKRVNLLYYYEPYYGVISRSIENPMTYAEALEYNDAQIAVVDELLAAVEEKVEAAKAAYEEADQAKKDAYDEYVKAEIEYFQDVEIPLPVAAYNAAEKAANDFNEEVFWPTMWEGMWKGLGGPVEVFEDNIYEAQKAQIAASKDFEAAYKEFEAKQKVTDTKKAALDKLQADYDKLVADARTAEKAMHQAELAYLADPKAETEKAWKEAEETYKKADKAAEEFKSEKLSPADTEYRNAFDESDAAQDTMLTAMGAKKSADEAVDEAKAQLEAKKEYDVRWAAVKLDYEGLQENVVAAKAEYDKWIEEGGHTEKGDAYLEAYEKYNDADSAAEKASYKYQTVLEETHYGSLLQGKSKLEKYGDNSLKSPLAKLEDARVASHENLAESVKTAEDTLAGEEEYTMICEKLVNAYKAKEDAQVIYDETMFAANEAYQQYYTCYNMIYSAENVESSIKECEDNIAALQKQIDYLVSGASDLEKLQTVKREIEQLEKQIAIIEALLESLNKELESHLANL